MAYGSARIFATPSKEVNANYQELSPELLAAAASSSEGEYKFNYLYGFRKLGDPLIDYRRESKQWSYPQDIEFVVQCHAEEGYCISYADIKTDQSSLEHEAKIISGGIGQNQIRILIKARNTYWYKYEVRMYGRKILQDINE